MSEKFPIGAWMYPSIASLGADEVGRWAKCGITITQSFSFSCASDDKARMYSLLDECEKYGIKLILNIQDLNFRSFTDSDGYRRLFQRVYNDFGKHPAAYGFHIGDEPFGTEEIGKAMEAVRIQKETAPELVPFLNMNPWFDKYDDMVLGGQTIEEWAKDYSEKAGGSMFCFDCYSQMLYPGGRKDHWGQDLETGMNTYYRNLRIFSRTAEDTGLDLWFTPLSAAHFNYRPASEDDIRWQMNTSVACGCRGIIWFFFYGGTYRDYRCTPIDVNGEETEVYRSMARVHKCFSLKHADLIMKLKHRKTYHIGKSYGEYPMFADGDHPLIKRVEALNGEPAVLSFFEDENGMEYTVIVSNNPFVPDLYTFILDKKSKKIARVENNSEEYFSLSHHDAVYEETADHIKAGMWLAPGQMEIFRFE